MKNLAGTNDTATATQELQTAGIDIATVDRYGECGVTVIGVLPGWTFHRLWYYWSARAEQGRALDKETVRAFDAQWGEQVRAHGYAGGGALDIMQGRVECFHIDTADGLKALAGFLATV